MVVIGVRSKGLRETARVLFWPASRRDDGPVVVSHPRLPAFAGGTQLRPGVCPNSGTPALLRHLVALRTAGGCLGARRAQRWCCHLELRPTRAGCSATWPWISTLTVVGSSLVTSGSLRPRWKHSETHARERGHSQTSTGSINRREKCQRASIARTTFLRRTRPST